MTHCRQSSFSEIPPLQCPLHSNNAKFGASHVLVQFHFASGGDTKLHQVAPEYVGSQRATHPHTQLPLCIVHRVSNRPKYDSCKDRKGVCRRKNKLLSLRDQSSILNLLGSKHIGAILAYFITRRTLGDRAPWARRAYLPTSRLSRRPTS
jgi:hypothetical protein